MPARELREVRKERRTGKRSGRLAEKGVEVRGGLPADEPEIGALLELASVAAPHRSARDVYAAGLPQEGEAVPLTDLGLLVPATSTARSARLARGSAGGSPWRFSSLPHGLLVDEPTNHLSLALVEELEEALRPAPSWSAPTAARHRLHWQGSELRLIAGHRAVPEDAYETELPPTVHAR